MDITSKAKNKLHVGMSRLMQKKGKYFIFLHELFLVLSLSFVSASICGKLMIYCTEISKYLKEIVDFCEFFVIKTCFFFLLYTGNLSKVCHNYESILTMIYIFDPSVLIILIYFLFSLWPNVQTTKFFQWIPHICQHVKVTKYKIHWLQMKFNIIIDG